MRNTSKALAAGLLLLTVACGPSTKLTSFWKDPSAGPLNFKKVLVMVISKDETVRRASEDEVVRQILKAKAVPSYTLFPTPDAKDQDRMKAKIKEDGFDGAIVMRMVDQSQQTSWVPGAYPAPYYSFYGYAGYGWGGVYDPGYMVTTTIVKIETNIYSVADNKLLWSGLSETFDPTGPRDTVQGVVAAVTAELRKQGLIT